MSDVSVIGLGDMGSALARTLLGGGYGVTVWNRTAAKAESLVREGATYADSPAAAIQASPVSIVCISTYEATYGILGGEDAASGLAGRVLVQLSTGTPQDAREMEAWAHGKGAEYLDGAILATPPQVGKPDTPIFVSGAETAYQRSLPFLKVLAGNLQYVGEPVGAASAWDMAFLSHAFGGIIGFFHGARIFESEGIRVDALGNMLADVAPVVGEMIRYAGNQIQAEDYANPVASLQTSAYTFDLLLKLSKEASIGSEFPIFAKQLFKKGLDAGYGHEDTSALIKALRPSA